VEYQTTRSDAEGMLQVMTGLERQLTEYAEREAKGMSYVICFTIIDAIIHTYTDYTH
jgi:hypothetical protein